MADTQIARFLVLHKELDPDDDELTRTRKVRRGFIAEKYAVLVDALYGGKTEQFIETQVRFEDGRTGGVQRDAARSSRRSAIPRGGKGGLSMSHDKIGDVILDVQNISLASAA